MNDYGWTARVIRSGRWSYLVRVESRFRTSYDCATWMVFGRARADRKARRILARRRLHEQRLTDTWTVGDVK